MTDTYKGWSISPPDMGPFWMATGPNYDASYEGPEDGWVDNGEKVEARTYKDLLVEIEDFEAAREPSPGPTSTCIEHQAGRPTQRLSFQIKVF